MTAPSESDFRTCLIHALPGLRAYARGLTGNVDAANDLVQETLLKALENQHSLMSHRALKPWLLTIMRNNFFATRKRSRREVEDADGRYAISLSVPAAQTASLELKATLQALDRLARPQREALILVCVEGLDYAAAAAICGCTLGTLKSRINRGRAQLARTLGLTAPGTDQVPAARLSRVA